MGLSSILKKKKEQIKEQLKEPVAALSSSNPFQFQIYSHNIRQDTNALLQNELPWYQRRQAVVSSIHHVSKNYPTIVGLQEVKHNQLHDILFALGSDWVHFGVGRDDGKTKGEFCPILFKKNQWELISNKTLWLSDTSEKVSLGWDSKCFRIVTIVELKHDDKIIKVMNTHFDHKGSKARVNSAKMLLKLIKDDDNQNIIICGDINSEKHEEAFKILLSKLNESSTNAKLKNGFEFTDTGFERKHEKLIDFIWSTSDIDYHEVLNNEMGSSYFSDHRPVTCIINLP